MFGVPPNTWPLVLYIGIFCYWALHYSMSFETIAGVFNGAFWWYGPLSEDQEIFCKSTETSSGFNFELVESQKGFVWILGGFCYFVIIVTS